MRVAIPEAARHPGVTEIRFETQHPWALQSMTVEAFGVSE